MSGGTDRIQISSVPTAGDSSIHGLTTEIVDLTHLIPGTYPDSKSEIGPGDSSGTTGSTGTTGTTGYTGSTGTSGYTGSTETTGSPWTPGPKEWDRHLGKVITSFGLHPFNNLSRYYTI